MDTAADTTISKARPDTYEELAKLIDTSDEWAVGCLVRLYHLQTPDEQQQHATHHLNAYGFNAFDAETLSNISQFYLDKKFLTPRQLAFIRKILKKYIRQLLSVGVDPLPVKSFTPTPEGSFQTASLLLRDGKAVAIQVRFNFPKGDRRFGETVANVKSLPDRSWIADQRYWRIGLSMESVGKLREWGFQFSEGLEKWVKDLTRPVPKNQLDMSKLDPRLYPFQISGVEFIESRNGRVLIGDEMGLGKTAQAISWLKLHPELRPVIVVCPASLKINWSRELGIWGLGKEKTQILSGKRNGYALLGQIIIINYDILTAWLDALEAYRPKVVIFDEVHYTKSYKAQRTKAAKQLAKKVPHIIALSGTPIVNRPIEFFNSINMIRRDIFPSYKSFGERFCGMTVKYFGGQVIRDFGGASNTDELHKLLTRTIMLRRLKKDVLKDLPDKIHSVVPFEIENREEYNSASADIIDWILKNEGEEKADRASQAEVLVEFEKLKQLAVKGKIESVKEWVADFLESGEKLVLFATHTFTLDLLQQAFPKISVRLDGSTSQKGRQEVVDQFQNNNEIRLFLGNVKAAGVGITLTASSNVGFVELPWTPGDYEQASDRLHRIGQKDAVNVWTLVAQDTVEEDVAIILSAKQKVLAAVLDGKDVDQSTILSELIRKVKERRMNR